MTQGPLTLENRRAIITGGSGGIGIVVASHFLTNGASICILGRSQERLSAATRELRSKYPGKFLAVQADIGTWTSAEQGVWEATEFLGGLDILVNAAGVQAPIGKFISNDIHEWERNIAINLFGCIYCCKNALPFMLRAENAAIVNFSGGGATSTRANFSAYAVAKTGIVRFTEVLADELRSTNVRVNAIAPGAINTQMLDEVITAGEIAGEEELRAAKQRAASGGASADAAAELVVYLASNASSGLTGKLISAVWDPWQSWNSQTIKEIMSGSQYNLRRIT